MFWTATFGPGYDRHLSFYNHFIDMGVHYCLDFTTPYGIGDSVYARHPPHEVPNTGGPAWPPYRHGKVAQVKLVLEESVEKALVVTQPTPQKRLAVACVIYTVIGPPEDPHQSAFIVECFTGSDSEPMLFHSEEEIKAYLQPISG